MSAADHVVFAILVVLALVYLKKPPADQRARHAPSPSPPGTKWTAGLGSIVQWPNVMRMLRYKAELSNLDAVLQAVATAAVPPMPACTPPR